MNAWYMLALPAWLILSVTAAARLADMGPSQWAIRDHFRRLGIIAVGVSVLCRMFTPLAEATGAFDVIDWQDPAMAWGWALVWITTPATPPWWDYILGVHRRTELWHGLGFAARIRGELQALRDSFRPRRYRPEYQGPDKREPKYKGPDRRGKIRMGTDPDSDFPRPPAPPA